MNVRRVARPVMARVLLEHPLRIVPLTAILSYRVEEVVARSFIDPEMLKEHASGVDAVIDGKAQGNLELDAYRLGRFEA